MGKVSHVITQNIDALHQAGGVPDGKVSLSLRLTFQADRTLTDAEVQSQFDAILSALVEKHGAVQR